MSPVLKMCARHRTLSSGRCSICAQEKKARGEVHTHQRGRNFRLQILARDNYECAWKLPGCKLRADTIDYIRALVNGGTAYDETNAVAACRSCNSKRGAAISNGGMFAGQEC